MCLMLGNKYLMDGKYERALAEYESCLTGDSESPEVLLMGLICAVVTGQEKKGQRFLKMMEDGERKKIVVDVSFIGNDLDKSEICKFVDERSKKLKFSWDGNNVSVTQVE